MNHKPDSSIAEGYYFRWLLVCFGLSIVLLLGAHVLDVGGGSGNRLLPMIIAAVPIAAYHLLILRPQAKRGLSQNAIDSVYYFGFLVTVAALGVSAVTISRSEDVVDVNAVVYQFGIGLIATGYAVFARLHLTSISREAQVANPERALDAYVQRSQGLIDNLDLAMNSFRALADRATSIATDIRTLHETIVSDIRKAGEATLKVHATVANELSQAFRRELDTRAKESIALLDDARAMFKDATFKQEREEFRQSVASLSQHGAELAAVLEASIRPVRELASHVDGVGQNLARVGEASKVASSLLGAAWGEGSDSAKAARALADASVGLAQSIEGVLKAHTALGQLSEQAAAGVSSHVRTSRTLARIDKTLEALEGSSARLETVFSRVGERSAQADQSVSQFAETVEKLSGAAPKLEAAESAVVKFGEVVERAAGEFEKSVNETVRHLETGVAKTAAAGVALSDNIVKIAEIVIERTGSRSASR